MTNGHILELAVVTVWDKTEALAARAGAMQAISTYPGFVSWRAVNACETSDMLADLVEWKTKEAAEAASKKVMEDPLAAPYMSLITSVKLMQRFTTHETL